MQRESDKSRVFAACFEVFSRLEQKHPRVLWLKWDDVQRDALEICGRTIPDVSILDTMLPYAGIFFTKSPFTNAVSFNVVAIRCAARGRTLDQLLDEILSGVPTKGAIDQWKKYVNGLRLHGRLK